MFQAAACRRMLDSATYEVANDRQKVHCPPLESPEHYLNRVTTLPMDAEIQSLHFCLLLERTLPSGSMAFDEPVKLRAQKQSSCCYEFRRLNTDARSVLTK